MKQKHKMRVSFRSLRRGIRLLLFFTSFFLSPAMYKSIRVRKTLYNAAQWQKTSEAMRGK